MPSIQDVADQINAKLDDINQHTADTVSRLDTLDADLDAGLGNLAEGLLAIWELQRSRTRSSSTRAARTTRSSAS